MAKVGKARKMKALSDKEIEERKKAREKGSFRSMLAKFWKGDGDKERPGNLNMQKLFKKVGK
jgi:hypothetical protein